MADIVFLSWNIENLGKKKIRESGGEIFNLIASVIATAQADVVGLMELPRGDTDKVQMGISKALEAATGTQDTWECCTFDPGFKEVYQMFWRTDRGFSVLKNDESARSPYRVSAGSMTDDGTGIVAGLVQWDKDGERLHFPTSSSQEGGRAPAYCVFKTDGSDELFSFLLYHAPGPGTFSDGGGYQLAQAYDLFFVDMPDGSPEEARRVVVAGDFNVDWNDASPSQFDRQQISVDEQPTKSRSQVAYGQLVKSARLERKTPDEKTSLIREPFQVQEALRQNGETTRSCRANAYDHIFERGMNGREGRVIDALNWIGAFPINRVPGLVVSNYWGKPALKRKIKQSGREIEMPWKNREKKGSELDNVWDAWLFHRYLVSDHLPVSIKATI